MKRLTCLLLVFCVLLPCLCGCGAEKREVEILVYVDENCSDAEAKSLGTRLNVIENVKSATFVSREIALKQFFDEIGNDEDFSGVDATMLRHRYVVMLEDSRKIKETVREILDLELVADVQAPGLS